MIIIICGVTGSGKTSVALQLADELGWSYIEGDNYHTSVKIDKMRRGIPLTDEDQNYEPENNRIITASKVLPH